MTKKRRRRPQGQFGAHFDVVVEIAGGAGQIGHFLPDRIKSSRQRSCGKTMSPQGGEQSMNA